MCKIQYLKVYEEEEYLKTSVLASRGRWKLYTDLLGKEPWRLCQKASASMVRPLWVI
jgi:hypothetical protein